MTTTKEEAAGPVINEDELRKERDRLAVLVKRAADLIRPVFRLKNHNGHFTREVDLVDEIDEALAELGKWETERPKPYSFQPHPWLPPRLGRPQRQMHDVSAEERAKQPSTPVLALSLP